MRKKVISLFLVTILFITCFSTVGTSDKISNSTNNLDSIVFPSEDTGKLNDFIEDKKVNEKGDVIQDINYIKNKVIIEDEENVNINLFELAEVMEEYNYEGVPETGQADPVQEFIDLIISMVQGRLGWVYQLIDKTTTIIQEAQTIIALTKSTIQTAIDLYQNVKEVLNLSQYLLKGQISTFLAGWTPRFYIDHIQFIINDLNGLINSVPQLINLITQTIQDSTSFINWLENEPWTDDVTITGTVNKLEGLSTTPLEGVKISCRNRSNYSDSNGDYFFMVSIDDTSDSIPPNSYYSAHNCVVIAEKDDEVKETIIPYVFSGGEIYKEFFFKDGNNKLKNQPFIKFNLLSRLNHILSHIFHFSLR